MRGRRSCTSYSRSCGRAGRQTSRLSLRRRNERYGLTLKQADVAKITVRVQSLGRFLLMSSLTTRG